MADEHEAETNQSFSPRLVAETAGEPRAATEHEPYPTSYAMEGGQSS
jgi:hypothetical protein